MIELQGTQAINLETGENLMLKYFLTSEQSRTGEGMIYGVSVQKELKGVIEEESITNISDKREEVLSILHILERNTVTPISLVEIVDDIVTERICG